MKEFFKSVLTKWEENEKLFLGIILPVLFFLFQLIYSDQFLDDTCTKVVKTHIIRLRPYFFYFSLLISIVVIILSLFSIKYGDNFKKVKERLRISEAKNELLQNNIRELFDGILIKIHKIIVNSHNDTRISIYYHTEVDGFIMIGRYSPNPTLNIAGRGSYPSGEGIIAEGWKNSWAFEDFRNKTAEQRIEIFKTKYAMVNPERLTMNPVQIAALRLTGPSDIPSKINLGVIVVETMNSGLCQEGPLQDILKEQSDYLATTIRVLQEFIPRPESAASIES